MGLSDVYNTLREAGSQVLTRAQDNPWLQRPLDYAYNHPFMTLGAATGALITWKLFSRPRDLPPGPFNFPVVGTVSIIGNDMEEKLFKLRPVYGDVIYLNLFGHNIVYLNSEAVIREAYIKQSDMFIHRLITPFTVDVGLCDDIFSAPYSEEWKENKKFFLMALKNFGFGNAKSEAKIHHGIDKLEAAILEYGGQPFDPHQLLKLLATYYILYIFFNQDPELTDDSLFITASMASDWLKGFFDGVMLDFVLYKWPRLRKIFCKSAIETTTKATQDLVDLLKVIIKEHKAEFNPTEVRDLVDHCIANKKYMDDEKMAINVLVLFPDGIESASNLTSWMLYYISKYQHVQDRLRQQIDEAIGRNRNTSLSDKVRLPFAEAIVLETMRHCNILGVIPPRIMKTDVRIGGYRLPKGTTVMGNSYAVHFDPDIFKDPEEFDPARFIGNDGKLNHAQAGRILLFGLGRRMCIGEQYVKVQLFLLLVRLIQKFNLTLELTNEPEVKDTRGMGKHPPPHKICFTPI